VTNNANCSWTTSNGTLATVTSAGASGAEVQSEAVVREALPLVWPLAA